jgi:hypothetical protein
MGSKSVTYESFCIGKLELFIPLLDIKEPYRLGVVGFQLEDPETQLAPFFFRGKIQHEPLYPTLGDITKTKKKKPRQTKRKKNVHASK